MLSIHDLPVPAVVVCEEGHVHDANAAAGVLLGTANDALGEAARNAMTAADDGRWTAALEGHRPDGVPYPLDLSGRVIEEGPPARSLVILRDRNADTGISDLAMQYFDAAFEQSPIGMALYDTDGYFVRVNDALVAMLDRPRDELLRTRDQELTHPDDRAADLAAVKRIMAGELSVWQCEKRFVRPDDGELWVIANLTYLRGADDRSIGWLGQFQDVTGHRHLAERDTLTGLYNRRRFGQMLDDALAHGERYEPRGALVLFDLDGFKRVNDSHGHPAGDEVLEAVSEAVCSRVRETDVVARLGGDEFALILPHIDRDGAGEVAAAVVEVIAGLRFGFAPGEQTVTASAGVAVFDADTDAETALAAADATMYDVKRDGGNGWRA